MKRYMYVAVRKDLSRAQQVVQACHAAIEASGFYHLDEQEHPSVIVLGMKNEQKLEEFRNYLDKFDWIHYSEFHEPDKNNELTAVAISPITEDYKYVFKKFQLLK